MPSNHDRDKPWDTDDIDKWKIEEFTPADNLAGSFAEESSFKILFPKYRENYLREAWSLVTRALDKFHIACSLDLVEGAMTVRTTLKTYDPAAILKARDLIKLLARAMPLPQAMKILEDGVACDVIKTRGMVRNREKFQKRRQRILGPNGSTLKALEMLTETMIAVQGGTVAAIGGYKGLKELRRVVEDCMNNIHPIYRIKELMIKRELAKDPALANENWSRFLPHFKPRTLPKRKKPQNITDKSKKPYTPFPPVPEKSKMDLQIESGEYFLSKQTKERAKREEREEQKKEKKAEKQKQREKDFLPPLEELKAEREKTKKGKKRKREGETEEERKERKERKQARKAKKEGLAS